MPLQARNGVIVAGGQFLEGALLRQSRGDVEHVPHQRRGRDPAP
jgi:hypothetical protein